MKNAIHNKVSALMNEARQMIDQMGEVTPEEALLIIAAVELAMRKGGGAGMNA